MATINDDVTFTLQTAALPPRRVQAPASLPCCIVPIAQVVYYDALCPEDTFNVMTRKGSVTSMAVLSVALLISTAVNCVEYVEERGNPAAIVYLTSTSLMSLWIALYAYMRYTRTAPDALIVSGFLLCISTLTMASVSTTYLPLESCVAMLMLWCGFSDVPHFWPSIALCMPAYIIAMYNRTTVRSDVFDYAPLMVHGQIRLNLADRLIPSIGALAFTTLLSAFVRSVTSEFDGQVTAAKSSALAASLIAQELGLYRTERARELLSRAAVSKKVVHGTPAADGHQQQEDQLAGADPDLVDALAVIVSNLEQYRPHLPNWMVNDAMTMPSVESSSVNGEPIPNAKVHRYSSECSETSSNYSNCSRRSRHSLRTENDAAAAIIQATIRQQPFVPTETYRCPQVARARIAFCVKASVMDSRTSVAAATNEFVDSVHVAAKTTKGAVHTFLGDVVEVSWNAASSVIHHNSEAARFLVLMKRLADGPLSLAMSINGAAMSGGARVQMAGKCGLQQALTLHIPWSAALNALSDLAAQYSTFVIDGAMVEAASEVYVRGVAALTVAEWRTRSTKKKSHTELPQLPQRNDDIATPASIPPQRTLRVFEIVGGHDERQPVEQWLYVGREDAATLTPHAVVTAALDEWIANNYERARVLVESLPPLYVAAAPMVAALVHSIHVATHAAPRAATPA
jgi:hypothetical protein